MAPSKISDDESSSDEDDDTPLAALANRKRSRTPVKYVEDSDDDDDDDDNDDESDEVEFENDEEDFAEVEVNEDDDFLNDDSDDDDDSDSATLASLTKKKTPPSKSKATKKKKPKSKSKSKSKTTKKKVAAKKKQKNREISESSSPAIVTPSSELYSKCTKGKIIQSLLCRWWYAITWPDPCTLPQDPPTNCDPLDGFPGVYVHTSGEEVGKIVDYRDGNTCPNFNNMAKKSSGDLKELLLKAIDVQRKQLLENEGEGTGTQKDLRELEKWVNKVNVGKADKEAIKALKAAGFAV